MGAGNEQDGGDSVKDRVRYFCVDDLYTLLDESPAEQGVQSDSDDGPLEESLYSCRDCVIVAVVREVFDDESGFHASSETTATKTRLRVRSNAAVFGPANTGCVNLSPYRLLRMDGRERAGIRPVAVLTVCEDTPGCEAFHDARAGMRLVHDSECGARNGGCFVIRDGTSGFPHRSS